MVSACSMHCFARNVTRPRSPGPAPTRNTLPLVLAIDPLQQVCCQTLGIFPVPCNAGCARRGRIRSKHLAVHLDYVSTRHRNYADRLVTIAMEQPQELAFSAQAGRGFVIRDCFN